MLDVLLLLDSSKTSDIPLGLKKIGEKMGG